MPIGKFGFPMHLSEMLTPTTEEVLDIIIRGTFQGMGKLDPEIAAMAAIDKLSQAAQHNPVMLLKAIRDAVEISVDGMAIVALAILTAKAEEEFLKNREHSNSIISILGVYGPPKLLEYIEYLKSKAFGRGFGSRPQKWVRSVMEGWRIDIMDLFLSKHTMAFYSLVRLVHPRYHGSRGKLLMDILDLKKTTI